MLGPRRPLSTTSMSSAQSNTHNESEPHEGAHAPDVDALLSFLRAEMEEREEKPSPLAMLPPEILRKVFLEYKYSCPMMKFDTSLLRVHSVSDGHDGGDSDDDQDVDGQDDGDQDTDGHDDGVQDAAPFCPSCCP
ncbi:hypothetical protein CC2G_007609 [Coprinopsis cinerea AmutBmut pab1-1]|nr:hypothetical protein CC2G_007609 [Coprinopsis cinerea AmutBmut pab1-1]